MKYLYLILLLLILPIVYAEEFNLKRNIPLTYKDIEITLLTVGNSGTIKLSIQGQEKFIRKGGELVLYDIKFINLDSNRVFQSSKVLMELQAECLVDQDCEVLKPTPCTIGTCDYRSCKFKETTGCPFGNECKNIGTFEDINKKLSYCSEALSWEIRKSNKEYCQYDYECLSNLCKREKCSNPLFSGGGNEEMKQAWILIVIGILLLFEAIFIILKPKLAKRFIKNSSFWPEKTWKTIALVEIIIALALIVWVLA